MHDMLAAVQAGPSAQGSGGVLRTNESRLISDGRWTDERMIRWRSDSTDSVLQQSRRWALHVAAELPRGDV